MTRVRAHGVDVHYETVGSGPRSVCLIHGTGGRGGVWTHQLEGLADVARIVAPDLPGHGESGGEPPRRIEESAACVAHFLDALDVRRVVIGGHSMGGGRRQLMTAAVAPCER
jgi:pimeloyl-ACP methyl ester carboxylesterase